MTRTPDISCTSCGRDMWSSNGRSLPQGEATCRPCRRKVAVTKPKPATTARPTEDRECPTCHAIFHQARPDQVYCNSVCRNARRNWGSKVASPSERGYGKEHRLERAKWKPIVEAGKTNCCLCGFWIEPGTKWHLDHTEDRTGYRGVAHAACNVRDGASRGARRTNANRQIEKACATCRAPFVTPYPKQRYCSRECRPKPEGKRVGAHSNVAFIMCATCSSLFASRNGRIYCDADCAYLAQLTPKQHRDCATCGTAFVGTKARLYCSAPCRPSHLSGAQQRKRRRLKGEGVGSIFAA